MILYCYKTMTLHDHKCDKCGYIYEIMCCKECDPYDELCYDCYCEYQRFMEKFK